MKSLEELLREAREAAYASVHLPAVPGPSAATSTIATRVHDYLRAAQSARKIAGAMPGPTVPQAPPAPKILGGLTMPALPEVYQPRVIEGEGPPPVTPPELLGQMPEEIAQPAEWQRMLTAPTDAEKAVMLAQTGRYTPGVPLEEQVPKPKPVVPDEELNKLLLPKGYASAETYRILHYPEEDIQRWATSGYNPLPTKKYAEKQAQVILERESPEKIAKADAAVAPRLLELGLPDPVTLRSYKINGLAPETAAKHPTIAKVLLATQGKVQKWEQTTTAGKFEARIGARGVGVSLGQPVQEAPTTGNKILDVVADLVGTVMGYAVPGMVGQKAIQLGTVAGRGIAPAIARILPEKAVMPAVHAVTAAAGGAAYGAGSAAAQGKGLGETVLKAGEEAVRWAVSDAIVGSTIRWLGPKISRTVQGLELKAQGYQEVGGPYGDRTEVWGREVKGAAPGKPQYEFVAEPLTPRNAQARLRYFVRFSETAPKELLDAVMPAGGDVVAMAIGAQKPLPEWITLRSVPAELQPIIRQIQGGVWEAMGGPEPPSLSPEAGAIYNQIAGSRVLGPAEEKAAERLARMLAGEIELSVPEGQVPVGWDQEGKVFQHQPILQTEAKFQAARGGAPAVITPEDLLGQLDDAIRAASQAPTPTVSNVRVQQMAVPVAEGEPTVDFWVLFDVTTSPTKIEGMGYVGETVVDQAKAKIEGGNLVLEETGTEVPFDASNPQASAEALVAAARKDGIGDLQTRRDGIAQGPTPSAEAAVAPPTVPAVPAGAVPAVPGPSTQIPLAPGELPEVVFDPKAIGVDPERFQFKTTGKEGVTSLLKGVTKWNPLLAGRILVWEDKDGRPWVVNGHHRLELAKRLNVPTIRAVVIREVDGVTEKRARSLAALTNMGEGRGEPLDVARFLRDSGGGPEELKNEGISLREKTVAQGLALAGLSDQLWRAVLDGDLKTDLGIVIGRDLPGDVVNQQGVLDLLARSEKQGRPLSDTILAGVIAEVRSGGATVRREQTLFGEDVIVSSNAIEKAEIVEYIVKQLRAQKTLFNKVSKTAFSQLLEKAGNILATDKNLEELTAADMGLELVQRLAYTKGSMISEILNQRAAEMAASQNRDQVKRQAFDEILALVKEGKALEESIGEPFGVPGAVEAVQAGPSLFGAGGAGAVEGGGREEAVPPIPPNAPGAGGALAARPAAETVVPAPAISADLMAEFSEEAPPDLAAPEPPQGKGFEFGGWINKPGGPVRGFTAAEPPGTVTAVQAKAGWYPLYVTPEGKRLYGKTALPTREEAVVKARQLEAYLAKTEGVPSRVPAEPVAQREGAVPEGAVAAGRGAVEGRQPAPGAPVPAGRAGEAPAPAVGQAAPGVKAEVVNARPDIPTPPLRMETRAKFDSVPELHKTLKPHQVEGTLMALQALQDKGAFACVDGPGAGKTRQGLAVGYIAAKEGKTVLVLTERDFVVQDAWMTEARAMGIQQRIEEWVPGAEPIPGMIQVATYSKMRSNVKRRLPLDGWDLVVLDECHNLKRTDVSQQAAAGEALMASSTQVLFVSATPFDRIHEYWYMGKRLGTFSGTATFESWLRTMGVETYERKFTVERENPITGEKETFRIRKKVYERAVPIEVYARNLKRMGDELTAAGMMVKRELSMDGLDVYVKQVELPEAAMQELDDISDHYSDLYKGSSKGAALTVIMQRRFLEKYKVDTAVELARQALAEGKRVGIFVEYKNESDVTEKVKVGGELMIVGTVAHAESVMRDLRAKLGAFVPADQIAELHGGLPDETPPDVEAEKAAFQKGEKRVAIATISLGATGISLHDDVGNAPRVQIIVTLPWSGVKQMQVAGRMYRYVPDPARRTRTKLIYLMANHEMDEHLAEILAGKMAVLGATVQGDLQKLDLDRGRMMAELDEATVRGADKDESESDRLDNQRVDAELRETQLYDTLTDDGLQRIDLAGPTATGGPWMAELVGNDPRYGYQRDWQHPKMADARHAYFEVRVGGIYEISDVAGRRILYATGDGWNELSGPTAALMLAKRTGTEKPQTRTFIPAPGPHLTQLKPTGKPSRGAKAPPSAASIIRLIDQTLTPVMMQHLRVPKAPAEYHVITEVIRLRELKLKQALHELGHHIDEKFVPYSDLVFRHMGAARAYAIDAGIRDAERGQIPYVDPKKAGPEIAAELFVGLMLEPEEVYKQEPAFNEFDLVLKATGLTEKIEEVRSQCKEYMGMTDDEKMDAQIVWTTKDPNKLGLRDINELFFDEFVGIARAEEAAVQRAGGTIRPSQNAYILAQLAGQRVPATVSYWLTVGQTDKMGRLNGKPSLMKILEPVEGPEETRIFIRYAAAKVIRVRIGLGQVFSYPADFYDGIIDKWETPERLKMLEEMTEWSNNYLELMESISSPYGKKQLAKWKKDHTFYLPLFRAMEETARAQGGGTRAYASIPNPIRKSVGGVRPILNPIVNLIQNSYVLANFAYRNEVGKAFYNLLEAYAGSGPAGEAIMRPVRRQPVKLEQLKPWIEAMVEQAGGDPKKIPDEMYDEIASIYVPMGQLLNERENELSIWDEGKPQYFQVRDPDTFRAFRALGGRSLGRSMRLLAMPARLVHWTAIMNPRFILMRNPFMDIPTAFKNSQQGQKPFIDFAKGLVMTIKKDPTVDAFKFMGGTFMKPGGWDRQEYEQNWLPKIMEFEKQQKARGTFRITPLGFFAAMERMAEVSEMPSRVREVQLSLRNPRWSEDYDNWLEAVWNGLEVTYNWRKSGSWVKEWAAVTPFFSTRFVIAKKTFDMWFGKPIAPGFPPRPGAWRGLFVRSLLMYTLPTLLLFALNRSNKDYEELPDWRKVAFWNIPVGKRAGRTVFLPIPRGSWEGFLFGGMVENILVNLYTEDKMAVDDFLKQLAQDSLPSFLPTFFQYVLIAANRDPFTGRPIVPRREENLPPEEQVAPYTTAVAQIVGAKLGLSPRKIDAAIRTYGSNLGVLMSQVLDLFLDGFTKDGRLPSAHPADWIGLRGVLVDPYDSPDSIEELYDGLAKGRGVQAKLAEGRELSASETDLLAQTLALQEGADLLAEIRALERELQNAPKPLGREGLTPEDRAAAIDRLRAVEVDIARAFLGKSPLPLPDVKK